MSSREKHKHLFGNAFVALLREDMYVDVPVYGLSMFPFYLPGDVVRVKKTQRKNMIKGNVIVFTVNNKLVAHRLLAVDFNKEKVITKGDGLIKMDGLLKLEDIHGVVVQHYRKGKVMKLINNRFAKKVILFFSPVMGFITFPLSRIWNRFWG
jgi:signal peptidase I